MLQLIPPFLRGLISERMGIDASRVHYFPSDNQTAEHEFSKIHGEFKLPLVTYYMTEYHLDSSRMNRPRARAGALPWDSLPNEDFPEEFLSLRLVPINARVDIHYWMPDELYVAKAVKAWFLWSIPDEGESHGLTIPVTAANGKVYPIRNRASFDDPVDASAIDYDMKGIYYHWVFSMTIKTWLLGFDTVKSILAIDARWFDDQAENARLLGETTIRPES
jgi:hypothetical protein